MNSISIELYVTLPTWPNGHIPQKFEFSKWFFIDFWLMKNIIFNKTGSFVGRNTSNHACQIFSSKGNCETMYHWFFLLEITSGQNNEQSKCLLRPQLFILGPDLSVRSSYYTNDTHCVTLKTTPTSYASYMGISIQIKHDINNIYINAAQRKPAHATTSIKQWSALKCLLFVSVT
jgi:hypothetical protein